MDAYTESLKRRIREYEQENEILWNAVRDIANISQSYEESKRIAQKAVDDLCPFLPLIAADVAQATEEARKAS